MACLAQLSHNPIRKTTQGYIRSKWVQHVIAGLLAESREEIMSISDQLSPRWGSEWQVRRRLLVESATGGGRHEAVAYG